MLSMPHASFEPLFISAVVMETLPEASSCTVTFWQTATGGVPSVTVMSAVQSSVSPEGSVAVKVTVVVPNE